MADGRRLGARLVTPPPATERPPPPKAQVATRSPVCPTGEPHAWSRELGEDGFPKSLACTRCKVTAPEPFCRSPQTCFLAGRCLSEIACNE